MCYFKTIKSLDILPIHPKGHKEVKTLAKLSYFEEVLWYFCEVLELEKILYKTFQYSKNLLTYHKDVKRNLQ